MRKITYIYPPDSVARGHVELLGKDEYLAVVKIYRPNNDDEFTLSAVDPVNAREKAEMLCEAIGVRLETFTVDKKIMDEWKNLDGYENMDDKQINPYYLSRY